MKPQHLIFYFFLFFAILSISACKKDKAITDTSSKISFSTDSVLFDTVFATIGSTTKLFKIYNKNNRPIVISRAYVATGSSSQFRINIDGSSGPSLSDIEILANDSLFVFVQVTVNPSGVNAPLFIKDSLVFETNGNIQDVKLTAIGQDVYLHKPTIFPTNGLPPYSLIKCINAWTNDKPHLIFGYAVVDTDSLLMMNPGTRVYMNKGAVLWVYRGGSLNINGTKGNEVTFQGIRLESDYKDIPGQWGKIWLMNGSKNNSINWAIIKNGSIGVHADSLGVGSAAMLNLNNTIIKNMSSAALYSQQGHIRSFNCVFANCGQYLAALSSGGNYTFQQCTFANYWSSSNRTTPLLYLNNYSSSATYNLDSAYFANCIIYGSLNDEVGIDKSSATAVFNYKFENCIVRTTANMSNDGNHYNTVYSNYAPGFTNVTKYDFTLTPSSLSIDRGFTTTINYDLNNQPRPNPNTSVPDLGAYEHY